MTEFPNSRKGVPKKRLAMVHHLNKREAFPGPAYKEAKLTWLFLFQATFTIGLAYKGWKEAHG